MKQIKIIGIGSGCANILNKLISNKQTKRKFSDKNISFCVIDSNKQLFISDMKRALQLYRDILSEQQMKKNRTI